MSALAGRRAVVTGATRGIGAAVARALAAQGAQVAVCGRDATEVDALGRELDASASGSFGLAADMGNAQDVSGFMAAVDERFGGADLLVNNVGASPSRSFTRMTDEDWHSLLELNLLSAVRCTRALLPGMRERRDGRVVMVASMAAKFPQAALIDYAASKAAMLAIAQALARQYGRDGVRVNSVLPGLIYTPMWERAAGEIAAARGNQPEEVVAELSKQVPQQRFGTPEEVAAAVLFLLGDGASYVNGVALDVDGGMGGHVH